MILTHGGNSVSTGENYILDDFVLVYNGLYNSGLIINHGSFGSPISDVTCPIKGAGCFDLSDIVNDTSLAKPSVAWYYQSEFNTLFNSNAWTFDFWVKIDSSSSGIISMGDANNARQCDFAEITLVSPNKYTIKLFGNDATNVPIQSGWNHVAFIIGGSNPGGYVNGTRVVNKGTVPYGSRYSIYIPKFNISGTRIANIGLRNKTVWNDTFTPPTLLYKQI